MPSTRSTAQLAIAAVAAIAGPACLDGLSSNPKIDVDAPYVLQVVDGFDVVESIGVCPAEGVGPLAELLLGECVDPAEWAQGDAEATGQCTDPVYVRLPDIEENPNPDDQRFRARVVAACSHPDLARFVGCGSADPNEAWLARSAVVIEFRDGLYPILPHPEGLPPLNYCPLVAFPLGG